MVSFIYIYILFTLANVPKKNRFYYIREKYSVSQAAKASPPVVCLFPSLDAKEKRKIEENLRQREKEKEEEKDKEKEDSKVSVSAIRIEVTKNDGQKAVLKPLIIKKVKESLSLLLFSSLLFPFTHSPSASPISSLLLCCPFFSDRDSSSS